MADITVTAAQIGVLFPDKAEIFSMIAGATITAGQAVYLTSSGTVDLADANGSGTLQFRGIALNGATAGNVVDVLKKGHCYGFTVSGVAYDAPLFVSNTAGALADAAGGTSINAGRVMALTDNGKTKVVYIEADWLRTWA